MYKYTKMKGLNSRVRTSLPKSKYIMNMAHHHRRKKLHAHHKTHLHAMKVYNTRPFSLTIEVSQKFCSGRFSFVSTLKYSLVPKKSTLSSDRIREPTRSGKARHLSNMLSRGDIYSQFRWDHNSHLLARTHVTKKTLQFFESSC